MSAHPSPSIALLIRRVGPSLIALAAIGLLLAVGLGCDDFPAVHYENRTSEAVRVFYGDDFVTQVEPGQNIGISSREDLWTPNVRVLALDGTVLLDASITWDELKEMDFTIVILGPGASPSPTPPSSATP
jgi:hypothetical protein